MTQHRPDHFRQSGAVIHPNPEAFYDSFDHVVLTYLVMGVGLVWISTWPFLTRTW
jgi:hypothetical protein